MSRDIERAVDGVVGSRLIHAEVKLAHIREVAESWAEQEPIPEGVVSASMRRAFRFCGAKLLQILDQP